MNAIQALIEQIRQQGDPVLAGQAALEVAETHDVLVRLLAEYWRPASDDPDGQWIGDDPRDVVCRYCGQRAGVANAIRHLSGCVVLRARALLT
jgi:hypothetical protein